MSWRFWSHVEKRLDKETNSNLKIFDVVDWKRNNYNAHIAQYLKKKRQSQTMKFGQLIEHNMVNIFLEKLYTKYGGEKGSRPFSKKSKLSIFLDQNSEICYSLFLL